MGVLNQKLAASFFILLDVYTRIIRVLLFSTLMLIKHNDALIYIPTCIYTCISDGSGINAIFYVHV